MNEITFLFSLSPTLKDRLRVSAKKERGSILGFIVQYESWIRNKWHPIIRYDTAHGFPHKDVLHPDGRTDKQPIYFANYNLAFTHAIQDIKILWQWYKESYKREMKND
ncbi:hypothetical protein KKH56_08580 [bacterium]|nr:hypothetical protein [bacterium]